MALRADTAEVLRLAQIVGNAGEPDMAEALHRLGHAGSIEYLQISSTDAARHRLRGTTDRGTHCAIALDRSQSLSNGAVLLLMDDRAIVVRTLDETWLRLEPRDAAAALELGYHAGNLHWRVRFDGPLLAVALEGPEHAYLDRLTQFLGDGRVKRARED